LLHTISDIGASDVIVFTPDGATLVAGGNGKTIELWDVARGTLRRQIEQPEVMSSMSLSRDGRLIAAGDNVGVVRIWRISDGALVHQWTAQNDDVSSLALSQDGALLASGGDFEDKTAHIWRVADGALLQTIKLRYSSNSIAFAPDERTIAIAAYRNVYLWRVP
jgi:WD40 repeat protein